MARLPIPGSDDGSWGDILNTYLSVAHNSDGTLASGSVTNSALADGAVTVTKLSAGAPSSGQVLSYDGSALDWTTITGDGSVPDADATTKGILKLDGDLSGTADTPTVPGLATKVDTTTTVNGHALSTNVTVTQSDVGLSNVNNTSDLNKPISTATQTALDAKADDSAVVHNTGAETIAGVKTFSSSPIVPDPTTNTQAANKEYVDGVAAAGAPDATATTKGILKLDGDLSGTADTPTVPGLATKANATTTITGTTSLTGGGDLSANRTIALVNDAATPGSSQYYGTNGSGTKGYFALPTGSGSGGVFTAVAESSNYTANNYDFVIGDASGAGFTVTLPVATNGYWVRVKKVDSSGNAILVVPQSGQIDDLSSDVVNTQWQSQDYASDGTKWYRI